LWCRATNLVLLASRPSIPSGLWFGACPSISSSSTRTHEGLDEIWVGQRGLSLCKSGTRDRNSGGNVLRPSAPNAMTMTQQRDFFLDQPEALSHSQDTICSQLAVYTTNLPCSALPLAHTILISQHAHQELRYIWACTWSE